MIKSGYDFEGSDPGTKVFLLAGSAITRDPRGPITGLWDSRVVATADTGETWSPESVSGTARAQLVRSATDLFRVTVAHRSTEVCSTRSFWAPLIDSVIAPLRQSSEASTQCRTYRYDVGETQPPQEVAFERRASTSADVQLPAASLSNRTGAATSATERQGEESSARRELSDLLFTARQDLEADEDTGVEEAVARFVVRYGTLAITVLYERLRDVKGFGPRIAAEVIKSLGRAHSPETANNRLWLMVCCLKHPSPVIRDAAALGLVAMRDSRAREPLERAARDERHPELRRYLAQAAAATA